MTFLSPEQIVKDLLKRISRKTRMSLAASEHFDILQLHESDVGVWIRNKYQLWNDNNPYTDSSRAGAGTDRYPTAVSVNILYMLRSEIQKKHPVKNWP